VSAPRPTDHHAATVAAAASIGIDVCEESHCAVVLLVDKQGRPFAQGHIDFDAIEGMIESLRKAASHLQGRATTRAIGHG
jgi:hypothetical protein